MNCQETKRKDIQAAHVQVHLSADTIDELRAAAVDLLHQVDDGLQLHIGAVEVIIVDIQLRVRVGRARRLECNRDEALAEDVRENGRAQGSVLVEDLVHDVLVEKSETCVITGEFSTDTHP